MKTIFFLILMFSHLFIHAQPGGGGGLIINKIYDENLKKINLTEGKIEINLLLLDSVMTVIDTKKVSLKEEIYIPTLNEYKQNIETSGLLIKYQNKKYRIDFENIWSENGSGQKEIIDSLVLFKPYILSKRNYQHPLHTPSEFQEYILLERLATKHLTNGITPFSYRKLSDIDLMFDSKAYAYNRNPKPWLSEFKTLYKSYYENNYLNKEKEIKLCLKKLNHLITKYGINDAFITFKILLLNEIKLYKEIVDTFEKHPVEFNSDLSYISTIVIHSYIFCKNYSEAKKLCRLVAEQNLAHSKTRYYLYIYHELFIDIYYLNKDRTKVIKHIFNNEKHDINYGYTFYQLKILLDYCEFKFKNKNQGIIQMDTYNKNCIPTPILNDVYPNYTVVIKHSREYCSSLTFGVINELLY